jgi:uncharacterized protein
MDGNYNRARLGGTLKENGSNGEKAMAGGRKDGTLPLPAVHDKEGDRVPAGLPLVVDAHVHLFPPGLFDAVWGWFDAYGWPIRYRLRSEAIIEFLARRGVDHLVALHYAHKPGIARNLNAYMAGICRAHRGRVTGLATVFPGEPEAARILAEGFNMGLAGVKLHGHVQCFDLQDPAMDAVYAVCSEHGKPLVMHVGREPKSPAYPCDPYALYDADKVESVLRNWPDLKVCVPHLGADEFDRYAQMAAAFDNLWLDTTMVLAGYLPMDYFPDLASMRTDRILYGTDFPNIPYAWDREIKVLVGQHLPPEDLSAILGGNARRLFGIAAGT